MRIIGGRFKGRALVPFSGIDNDVHLRPTSDRTREGIFNILMHNSFARLDGARVLDLFAGTGALGLEALSRGASHVTFVDNNTQPRTTIKQNIAKLAVEDYTSLRNYDAAHLPPNHQAPFDLVFADPPYNQDLLAPLLSTLQSGKWIDDNSVIVTEFAIGRQPVLPGAPWYIHTQKKYGKAGILFLGFNPL